MPHASTPVPAANFGPGAATQGPAARSPWEQGACEPGVATPLGTRSRRGAAVLLRTTRLVASSTRVAADGLSCRPRSSTSLAAASAISISGCRTVVSGGPTQRATGRSSKPTTLRSSGMRSPSSRAAS